MKQLVIIIFLLLQMSNNIAMHNQEEQIAPQRCAAAAFKFLRGTKQSPRVDSWNAEWDPYGNHAIQGPFMWRLVVYGPNWKKLGRLETEWEDKGNGVNIKVKADISPCTHQQVIDALQAEYFGKKEKI